jgi:isopenicillin-N epimerase
MTDVVAPPPAMDPLHRPDLWEIDPGVVTYVNHGAFGRVSLTVRAERRSWQDLIDANPMGFFRRTADGELDRVRLAIARFLGSDDQGVALTQNATTGIATVLASLPLGPGDRILVTDHIYGAVRWNADLAARRTGAVVDEVAVPLGANDDEAVEAILAGVREGTKYALLDHISSTTAKLFPIERIVAALHERDVRVIVDAAHAPGAVPVDLGTLGADYWAGNIHKWAGAPRGTAGLYASPESRAELKPIPLSWREPEGFPNSFSFVGTADQTAWLAAPAGLEFFEKLGWEAVRKYNNTLVRIGQLLIAEAIGASLEGMPGEGVDEYPLPMRLIPLDGVPADEAACIALTNRLAQEYLIECPVTTWNGRALLRICAQLYNSAACYERVAEALKDLL